MKEKLKQLHREGKLVGIFDLTQEEYRAAPGISRSSLMNMSETAAHFKYAEENPKESTPAMVEGSALHALVLEPETYEGLFQTMPESIKKKGTKKYDAWIEEEELEKCTIISQKQWEMIDGMNQSVGKNKRAKMFLSGYHEKCFFWKDPITGILLKCKPDSIHLKAGVISDLKSTDSASPEEFIKKCYNLGYHIQDAFYTDGVIEAIKQGGKCGLEFKEPDKFMFVAVEKKPPYLIAFYDLPEVFVDEGRRIYRKLIDKYADAVRHNKWEGYSDKVITLESKSWMYSKEN